MIWFGLLIIILGFESDFETSPNIYFKRRPISTVFRLKSVKTKIIKLAQSDRTYFRALFNLISFNPNSLYCSCSRSSRQSPTSLELCSAVSSHNVKFFQPYWVYILIRVQLRVYSYPFVFTTILEFNLFIIFWSFLIHLLSWCFI